MGIAESEYELQASPYPRPLGEGEGISLLGPISLGLSLTQKSVEPLPETACPHPPAPAPRAGEGGLKTLSPRPVWERGTQGVRGIHPFIQQARSQKWDRAC
jgi:hypothetical protein